MEDQDMTRQFLDYSFMVPKLKVMVAVITVSISFFWVSCSKGHFDEYPPDRYLTDREKNLLMNKFIYAFFDTIQSDKPLNEKRLRDLENIFELEYYVRENGKRYFMVSETHNPFFDAGFICYLGEIEFTPSDTVFIVKARMDAFTQGSEVNVKEQFDSLRRKN